MTSAHAPVRCGDVGGWTDTWFAERGCVFSIAVEPGVRVDVSPATGVEAVPESPLVRAAAGAAGATDVRVEVTSAVPAGAALGSSAAVCVAVLRALAPGPDLAARAHAVELGLGWQSGVQDQVAAAHGGVNCIDVDYPTAKVAPLTGDVDALDRALVVVYLGRPHVSTSVHDDVIARGDRTKLAHLAALAAEAATAYTAGDLPALGALFTAATEGQRALHPALVSEQADALAQVAAAAGAWGTKVNGAGGDGGSLTFLAPDRDRLLAALAATPGPHRALDLHVAAPHHPNPRLEPSP